MFRPQWPSEKIPKVAWSLLDQVVVSAGNFFFNISLARLLSPKLYGTFTILYLVILTLNTCQSSLVNYWLSIRGPLVDSAALKPIFSGGLILVMLWAIPFSGALLIAHLAVHARALWFSASICMLAWQLQETSRRALFSHLRYEAAIVPDSLSYIGQVILVQLLRPTDLSTTFYIIAATSLVALVWQAGMVGVVHVKGHKIRDYFIDSFSSGKFMLIANGLNMLVIQVPVWTLLAAGGKDAVAIYQALINLNSVVNPLLFGLNNHLVPAIARAAARGLYFARNVALREGGLVGVLALLYIVIVLFSPEKILVIFYGRASEYLTWARMVRWLMLGCLFYYFGTVLAAYEAGVGRTESYMYSQTVTLIIVCAAGIPLIMRGGIEGAVFVSVGALIVRAIALGVCSVSRDRRVRMQLDGHG